MIARLAFALIWGLTANECVYGGTISASGGALRKYETNPWFLENTTQVSYCVDQDPDAFHLPPAIAVKQIASAIEQMKSWFRRLEQTTGLALNQPRVATQEFIYVAECSSMVDLMFMLGKLTPEQKEDIAHPREWVGAAVMTSYDKQDMRGKGYIYIGADTGDLRMDSAADRIAARPWTACGGLTLRHIVMHELGHVFGLAHEEHSIVLHEQMPSMTVSQAHIARLNWGDGVCPAYKRAYEQDFFPTLSLHREFQYSMISHDQNRLDPPLLENLELRWIRWGDELEITLGAEKRLLLQRSSNIDRMVRGSRRLMVLDLPRGNRVLPDVLRQPMYPVWSTIFWTGFYEEAGQRRAVSGVSTVDHPLSIWMVENGVSKGFSFYREYDAVYP